MTPGDEMSDPTDGVNVGIRTGGTEEKNKVKLRNRHRGWAVTG